MIIGLDAIKRQAVAPSTLTLEKVNAMTDNPEARVVLACAIIRRELRALGGAR